MFGGKISNLYEYMNAVIITLEFKQSFENNKKWVIDKRMGYR